nr:MAG TPA: hypothetical protein [Caudoviricetes sp.]
MVYIFESGFMAKRFWKCFLLLVFLALFVFWRRFV